MDKLVQTKYYLNNNNLVDNNNYGESRTMQNLLNLINYKNYCDIFKNIIENNSNNINILEIGCGLGISITELSYLFNNNNYYAINMGRKGVQGNGYERHNYSKEYITEFMTKYNFDITNKKMINHFNHDLYSLSIFNNNFFDLIYSQSTIGKTMVKKSKDRDVQCNKLVNTILKKLKHDGVFINHLDSIKKFDYTNRNICSGHNYINNIPIYFDIYFSDNNLSQDQNNLYTEISIYILKLNSKIEKNIIFDENNLNICKDICVHNLFKILSK